MTTTWQEWVQAATANRGAGLLHRDGHQAGAGRRGMTPADWDAMNNAPIIRADAAINAGVEDFSAYLETLPATDVSRIAYPRGAITAVAWARGETRDAPSSGRTTAGARPLWVEIAAEIDYAEDAIYKVIQDDRVQSWHVGVEAALMWLIGDGDEPPW